MVIRNFMLCLLHFIQILPFISFWVVCLSFEYLNNKHIENRILTKSQMIFLVNGEQLRFISDYQKQQKSATNTFLAPIYTLLIFLSQSITFSVFNSQHFFLFIYLFAHIKCQQILINSNKNICKMNVFLFHRDLRIFDNTTLISQFAQLLDTHITPIFILPPEQIDPKKNKYFSNNSVQFMIQSLRDLNKQIEQQNSRKKSKIEINPCISFFMGSNLQVLEDLHKNVGIKSLGFNIDYTPYAKKRDQQISKWANKNKIRLFAEQDYLLHNILKNETCSSKTGKPYLVFTPFKNFCMGNLKVRKPTDLNPQFKLGVSTEEQNKMKSVSSKITEAHLDKLFQYNEQLLVHGGRNNSLDILNNIIKQKDYNKNRNFPALKTTRLSAHLHFTTVSIRQTYHTILAELGIQNNLINELYWRDFYCNIAHFFPNVLGDIQRNDRSFKSKFDQLPWKVNNKHLEAWKNGTTGFPIVDAAMRQMNHTGYMHNRCRMIVASFFSKDLFLDWRLGQQYFANKLTDYSAMQNSGGWQWSVGNGTDSQPYFRIFNPWTQQKNFDQNCIYIKKWVPQLSDVPNDDIHKWNTICDKYLKKGIKYVKPIIDHDSARKEALQIYKLAFKGQ